jgi:hypothetical protein
LLQRRHIRIGDIEAIGKESNSLEDVEAGLVHDEDNIYTSYPDPHRIVWATTILPAVKRAPSHCWRRLVKGDFRDSRSSTFGRVGARRTARIGNP